MQTRCVTLDVERPMGKAPEGKLWMFVPELCENSSGVCLPECVVELDEAGKQFKLMGTNLAPWPVHLEQDVVGTVEMVDAVPSTTGASQLGEPVSWVRG